MKKFLLLLTFCLAYLVGQAQTVPSSLQMKTNKSVVQSTIIKNDTLTGIFTAPGYCNLVGVEVDITKATGKIGTSSIVRWYGSISGQNYDKLDSLALTDVARNYKIMSNTTPKYFYYKVVAKIDSTHTGTINVQYLTRKEFGQ